MYSRCTSSRGGPQRKHYRRGVYYGLFCKPRPFFFAGGDEGSFRPMCYSMMMMMMVCFVLFLFGLLWMVLGLVLVVSSL